MKQLLCLFTFILLAVFNLAAQDIIILKSGDELNGKILKINPDDVVFTPKGISDTVLILRDDITKLRYQDGTYVWLVDKKADKVNLAADPTLLSDSAYNMGISDAIRYYDGYTGAMVGTLVAGLIFPFNVIPAIACSATPPKVYNLTLPDHKLNQNPVYLAGYKNQAHKIKRRKVWMGYGIGTGVIIAIYVLIGAI